MESSRSFSLGMIIFNLLVFTILCLKSSTVSGGALYNYEPFSSCDYKLRYSGFLNCSKRGLSSVPYGLSPPLKKICLAYNYIQTISSVDFENATSVKELILKHNIISKIDSLAFYSLKKLDYLDLSYNEIANLETNLFKNNDKLKILKLTGNNFVYLNNYIESNSLEMLYLENCNINSISTFEFYHLPNLVSLFLDNNPISIISVHTVMPLPKLKYLSILNEEHCLPESYQKLTEYLQRNEIPYMPWTLCRQESIYDNGITTWSSGYLEEEEKNWNFRNSEEARKRNADFHKHIARTLIITLVCVFIGGFICVIIIYECFILKKKTSDSETHNPTAPPLAEADVHEKLPWYKQLLKIVLFKVPRDGKENAQDTINPTPDPVQTNRGTPNSENNNRY